MKKERRKYDINLSALEDGTHTYAYKLSQSFFDMFDFADFDKAEIDVKVVVVKSGNLMKFNMESEGSVELPDDRTGHLYRQPVKGNLQFLVKYGETFNDDDDELIIIPYNQGLFNIAQQIYEMAVLSVPMKHLDPSRPADEEDEAGEEQAPPASDWKAQLLKAKQAYEKDNTHKSE
ncbi:MAG: DUF177 domain-containing protein [Chlorobi bacterium]|nr:DUF177 domain-containing protein [Chlorobiota bacterium]